MDDAVAVALIGSTECARFLGALAALGGRRALRQGREAALEEVDG
jgi:hypothetical protein